MSAALTTAAALRNDKGQQEPSALVSTPARQLAAVRLAGVVTLNQDCESGGSF